MSGETINLFYFYKLHCFNFEKNITKDIYIYEIKLLENYKITNKNKMKQTKLK